MSCSACVNNFQPMSLTCPDMLPSRRSRIASTSKELELEDGDEDIEEDDERDLNPEFEAPEEDARSPRWASFGFGHSGSLRFLGTMPPMDA